MEKLGRNAGPRFVLKCIAVPKLKATILMKIKPITKNINNSKKIKIRKFEQISKELQVKINLSFLKTTNQKFVKILKLKRHQRNKSYSKKRLKLLFLSKLQILMAVIQFANTS